VSKKPAGPKEQKAEQVWGSRGERQQEKSKYRNTAFAIEALIDQKNGTLTSFEEDTDMIMALTSLDMKARLKINSVVSKWIGWAGIAIHPVSPDLLKRTVTYMQESKTEEQEPKEGNGSKLPSTVTTETTVTPLVSDLRVTDIIHYSKLEDAMRLIAVEMRAFLRRVDREYAVGTLSPAYASSFAIQNIQIDLAFRSAKMKNAIESAYDSLIKDMIATLGKVEQFAVSGIGMGRLGRRPIQSITPTEAEMRFTQRTEG